jgi:hypothetical protein
MAKGQLGEHSKEIILLRSCHVNRMARLEGNLGKWGCRQRLEGDLHLLPQHSNSALVTKVLCHNKYCVCCTQHSLTLESELLALRSL